MTMIRNLLTLFLGVAALAALWGGHMVVAVVLAVFFWLSIVVEVRCD